MKIDSLHTCDDDFDKNILQVIIGIMANMPQEIVNIICTYIFKCEYFYDNCPLINYECFLKDELKIGNIKYNNIKIIYDMHNLINQLLEEKQSLNGKLNPKKVDLIHYFLIIEENMFKICNNI
jgi:hypothetical protein